MFGRLIDGEILRCMSVLDSLETPITPKADQIRPIESIRSKLSSTQSSFISHRADLTALKGTKINRLNLDNTASQKVKQSMMYQSNNSSSNTIDKMKSYDMKRKQ